jgi:S-DNA-T family DNA segregation ATPase FtsK/SpoIIIE
MDILSKTGELFPRSPITQLTVGITATLGVMLNYPELSLGVVGMAMAGRALLNYRNNDQTDDIQPITNPVVASDDIGLVKTISDYGFDGAMLVASHDGVVINRYTVRLPHGSRIKDLPDSDDLAMALGVASVDILPSKQKMCREFDVPRIDRQYVDFDSLMQSSEWAQAKGSNMALPVCPAVTIEGKPYIIDLKDGVHYFIPGTTGAGKSVFANALMLSLIDSGRDFTLLVADGKSRKGDFYPYYSKSEYLLNDYRDHVQGEPICKGAAIEPEDMAAQFEWLVWAMEQRFSGGSEDMTPIIYLMDEMKDVVDMLSASDDKNALKAFTRNVGRLAQKARSVNITILFCTQSPNSEWLPQTLRAVIPSVFAFAVSSAAQSRVCIGENGCEKLLGKGDGYAKINGKTTRIHGANVTIDHIGRYLK